MAKLLLLSLLLGISAQGVFGDSITFAVKPSDISNVSVSLSSGDTVRFSVAASSWRGADEIGFTIIGPRENVVFNAGKVKQYASSYTADSGGTYYLTFDNRFSTFTSKTVSVNYSIIVAPVGLFIGDGANNPVGHPFWTVVAWLVMIFILVALVAGIARVARAASPPRPASSPSYVTPQPQPIVLNTQPPRPFVMYCIYCGVPNPGVNFCYQCGRGLR